MSGVVLIQNDGQDPACGADCLSQERDRKRENQRNLSLRGIAAQGSFLLRQAAFFLCGFFDRKTACFIS